MLHPRKGTFQCDIFCRVIDNYGDAGVAWRLSQSLLREAPLCVRLIVDKLETLSAIVPEVDPAQTRQTVQGIEVVRWDEATEKTLGVADGVIEAFSCYLPPSYEAGIAKRFEAGKPVSVIALDYLTAEDYAGERHALPSPHPRYGYPKRFFFPGFTARTGGLFIERDYAKARDAFSEDDAAASLVRLGVDPKGPAKLFLFTYPEVDVGGLATSLAATALPLQVLLAPGKARELFLHALDADALTRIRPVRLPFLTQSAFDQLLWACDALIVRGEDSASRAMLSGKPFLWTLYPQEGGVHIKKMLAFEKTLVGHYPEAELAVRNALEAALNAGKAPDRALLRRWLIERENHARASRAYASHLLTLPRVAEEITKMFFKGLK